MNGVPGTGCVSMCNGRERGTGRGGWRCHWVPPVATVLSLLLAINTLAEAESPVVLEVGKFSAAAEGPGLPDGWKPLTFKKIERHTTYTLVKDGEAIVVKAVSEASSSGLTKEIKINPKEYPIVEWRWKVSNIYKNGDVSRKEGDDYPARLYITFEYDAGKVGFFKKAQYEAARMLYGQYPPGGAINYIWESKAPKGTIVPNSYTDQVMMFIVESGAQRLNQWVSESRNLYDDYKKAFDQEPPVISGVAIMTDTDNTKESATTYYGDIVFKKAEN